MRKSLVAAALMALALVNLLAVEWSTPAAPGRIRVFNDPAELPVLVPKDDPGMRIPWCPKTWTRAKRAGCGSNCPSARAPICMNWLRLTGALEGAGCVIRAPAAGESR